MATVRSAFRLSDIRKHRLRRLVKLMRCLDMTDVLNTLIDSTYERLTGGKK